MRFMTFLKADRNTEANVMPSEKLLADMGQLMEDMAQAGVLLAGEGLKPSAESTRVFYTGGKTTVIDGPFTEAKELVAGYCLLNVKSKEEAIEWSLRCLKIHVEGTGIEFRPGRDPPAVRGGRLRRVPGRGARGRVAQGTRLAGVSETRHVKKIHRRVESQQPHSTRLQSRVTIQAQMPGARSEERTEQCVSW